MTPDEFDHQMRTARHWVTYARDVNLPPSPENNVDILADSWISLAWKILRYHRKGVQAALEANRIRVLHLPPPPKGGRPPLRRPEP